MTLSTRKSSRRNRDRLKNKKKNQKLASSKGVISSTRQSVNDANASTSNSRKKKGKIGKNEGPKTTTLSEYQWPPSSSNYYVLQSQLSRFVNEPTLHQRYMGLHRRRIDVKERQYLRQIGLLDNKPVAKLMAIQCNYKLMDVMQREYPDKYRQFAKYSKVATPVSSTSTSTNRSSDKPRRQSSISSNMGSLSKQQAIFKEAVYHAAEFNSQLAKERREERSYYFDIQTQRIHVPANATLRLGPDYTKRGNYPVAIVAGQYCDSYHEYTSEQLKSMPVKTVLKLPSHLDNNQIDESTNDKSDHSIHTDDVNNNNQVVGINVSRSKDGDRVRSRLQELSNSFLTSKDGSLESYSNSSYQQQQQQQRNVKANGINDTNTPLCNICSIGALINKFGLLEELIKCSQCGSTAHPNCLELTPEMVSVIKTYKWQCMDCKTCTSCSDPYDEDKMMFCDRCDRGFHTFCVGLDSIPSGKWICNSCTQYVEVTQTSQDPTSSYNTISLISKKK